MRRILLTLFILFPIGHSTMASATPFEITFSGVIESLTTLGTPGAPNLETRFAVGNTMSGRIIIDDDSSASASVSLFEITVDGYTATSTTGSAGLLNDNMAGSSAPVVDSILINGPSASGAAVAGLAVDAMQFSLGTETLSVLGPSSILNPATVLALWNDTPNYFSGNLNWMFFEADEGLRFALQDVSARSLALPEPPIASALILGLLGVLLPRVRRSA